MRRLKKLNSDLGTRSTVDGLSQVPIHTYKVEARYEAIRPESCPFAEEAHDFRYNTKDIEYTDGVVFKDKMYLVNDLKETYAKYFGLSEEKKEHMTFPDVDGYSDFIMSEHFHGIKLKFEIPQNELDMMNSTSKWGIQLTMDAKAREAYVTKLLDEPLK